MDAILRGRDHVELTVTEVLGIADDVALALTRGAHPKLYDYVDPNEDVVAVRRRGDVTALVVADGHNGHEGSQAAVDALLAGLPDPLPASLDQRTAVLAFHAANEHLRAVRSSGPNHTCRTTMVLGLVHRAEDGSATLTTASIGDSAIIVVRDDTAVQITNNRHRFLGDRLSAPEMAGFVDYAVTDLRPGDVIIAASDGFTHFADPGKVPAVVRGAADPAQAAQALVDLAGEGGAGDNVAIAVLGPLRAPRRQA